MASYSVILLFCYSVILLFCYSVILLFCYSVILLFCYSVALWTRGANYKTLPRPSWWLIPEKGVLLASLEW